MVLAVPALLPVQLSLYGIIGAIEAAHNAHTYSHEKKWVAEGTIQATSAVAAKKLVDLAAEKLVLTFSKSFRNRN